MIPTLRLRTWLLLSHVAVLALPVLAVVGTGAMRNDLHAQTRDDLRNQAALISLLVQAELDSAPEQAARQLSTLGDTLRPTLVRAREATLAGIRIVDQHGVVVASSGDELGEDLSGRPEVTRALAGVPHVLERPRTPPTRNPISSPSRRASVRLFLGEPLQVGEQTIGAVILSRTPREELQALYRMLPWWTITLPTLVTAAIALLAGWFFSRSIARLERTASELADGTTGAGTLDLPESSHVFEVRRLATSFGTTAHRLQDRLTYIREFAGNVSHEFKTPLSTLRGTAELLVDDPDMPDAQRQRFLDNALAELDHLERLVGGLLALARADEHAHREPVDLDAWGQDAARRHGVPLEGSAGMLLADRTQLDLVLDNLVDNALTHGGEGVSVRIRLWRREGVSGFDVVDDGVGISPANLPRVFDRFFTTRRGTGGTGLGLALVQAICRAHGGRATVESAPGRTVFSIALHQSPEAHLLRSR